MQNRSIFPYRRHGPKKRVKHGPNHKPRGPHKGLPNSARDLLPMLQPATKALAQVLAGRAGVSGQLGHARAMLAQAERMIAERAHNRLTPAEREEFFEQLARLKLTLADADAEAEVQAVEEDAPRAPMPPVGQERLMEMALALSGPGRQGPKSGPTTAGAAQSDTVGAMVAREAAAQSAKPAGPADEEDRADAASDEPDRGATPTPGRGDRLVLPKARADQVAQAVAFGGISRRRTRASSRALTATASAAAEEALRDDSERRRAVAEPPPKPSAEPGPRPVRLLKSIHPPQGDALGPKPAVTPAGGGEPQNRAAEAHDGNGASAEDASPAKTPRRGRKPKHQGLPEGWVIDEEGFVVPGAG